MNVTEKYHPTETANNLRSRRRVMNEILDCDLDVNEFEFQLRYNVHFWTCSRKNFKLLSGAGIFWLFWSRTHFRPMRIFHTILPGSFSRATIKRRGNVLSPSSMQAFRAGLTCLVFHFSLPHWLATGQASQHDRTHILSLRFLTAGRTSQHERPYSLFFTDSSSLTLSHIFRVVR